MLSSSELERYRDIAWEDYVYLDDTSPTGLRWKQPPKHSKSKPGGQAGRTYLKTNDRKTPFLYKGLNFLGKTYSVPVVTSILKGELVSPHTDSIPFKEDNTKWIQENAKCVWWTIQKYMHRSAGVFTQAKVCRIITAKWEIEEDFLQDVFSDACIRFNRNYTPSKGEPTTYIWWAVKGAVTCNLRKRYRYASHNIHMTNENDNPIVEATTPDTVAGMIEAQHVSKLKQDLHKTAAKLFKTCNTTTAYGYRTQPGNKAEAVFKLQMQGLRDNEIADKLKISRQRVAQYKQWYMRKLKQLYKGREELLYS